MKWEYQSRQLHPSGGYFSLATIDTQDFDGWLNQMGEDGWELASMVGINDQKGQPDSVVATMKRPKSD